MCSNEVEYKHISGIGEYFNPLPQNCYFTHSCPKNFKLSTSIYKKVSQVITAPIGMMFYLFLLCLAHQYHLVSAQHKTTTQYRSDTWNLWTTTWLPYNVLGQYRTHAHNKLPRNTKKNRKKRKEKWKINKKKKRLHIAIPSPIASLSPLSFLPFICVQKHTGTVRSQRNLSSQRLSKTEPINIRYFSGTSRKL